MRCSLFALVVTLPALGCDLVAGLGDHEPFPSEAGSSSREASTSSSRDSSRRDTGGDAHHEAGESLEAGAPAYGDLHDNSRWEFFEASTLAPPGGFVGGAVVGHYAYFAAEATSLLRYDAASAFGAKSSWTLISSPDLPASTGGLVPLGNYLYVTPEGQTYGIGQVDTSGPLDGGAGTFQMFVPRAMAHADFQGGCTDGKTVYFVPSRYLNGASATPDDILMTYDPSSAGFDVESSWTATTLPTAATAPPVSGLSSCIFDGRYVYFGNSAQTVAARYDTTLGLMAPSAWSTFDLGQLASGLSSFAGLVFTGRYVVFIPDPAGMPSAAALAYDTTGLFGASTSWTRYTLVDPDGGAAVTGYAGGQFDGRYVYMAPTTTGLVLRWDSRHAFDDRSAWEAYDLAGAHPGATSFYGTAFDGQYVYFSAHQGTVMARFRARETVAHLHPPASFF